MDVPSLVRIPSLQTCFFAFWIKERRLQDELYICDYRLGVDIKVSHVHMQHRYLKDLDLSSDGLYILRVRLI